MTPFLLEAYLLIAILIGMIWYAGYEGTMRVFVYLELQIKYLIIRIKMYFMEIRMRREFKKLLRRSLNDRESQED